MNVIFRILIVYVIISPLIARAQDSLPAYLGIKGFYEYGSPIMINRSAGVINTFTTQGNGVSWNNSFASSIELQLPELFSPKWGLSLAASYCKGSGEFKSSYFQDLVADKVEDFRIYTNSGAIGLQALVTFVLSSKLYVGIGGWWNFRITGNITQQLDTLTSAGTITSIDTIASGDAISTSKFHYGIPVAVGGRFRFSRTLSLNAEIFSRMDLAETFRGFSGSALSGGISLGLLFDLNPPSPQEETKPPPPPVIFITGVSFNINSVTTHQTSPRIIDTLVRRYLVLPLAFSLETNSISSIFRLLSKSEADAFDYTFLDRASPEKCFQELLNILGKRMREYPMEKIIVSGNIHSAEVKDYLVQIWKLSPDRITISVLKTETLSLGGSMKICSPLINEWTEERYILPEVSIGKVLSSNNGIRKWEISLLEGKKILTHYSSDEPGIPEESAYSDPNIANSGHLLVAKLTAFDTLGNIRESFDSLHVIPVSESAPHSSVNAEKYLIPVDSLSNSGSWASVLLERAAKSVTAENTVTISGYKKNVVGKKFLELVEKNNRAPKKIIVVSDEEKSPSGAPESSLAEVSILSKQQ